AVAFLATAGDGLATFAVTHADPTPPCPSDSVVIKALTDEYGKSSITDKMCGPDGYVAVTAEVSKGAAKPESRAADSGVEHIALRLQDGAWTVVADKCDDPVPKQVREYVGC
ncbi:MAG: hypothetical protein ACRD0P_09460, partial [Stackebrandtia sp.]